MGSSNPLAAHRDELKTPASEPASPASTRLDQVFFRKRLPNSPSPNAGCCTYPCQFDWVSINVGIVPITCDHTSLGEIAFIAGLSSVHSQWGSTGHKWAKTLQPCMTSPRPSAPPLAQSIVHCTTIQRSVPQLGPKFCARQETSVIVPT